MYRLASFAVLLLSLHIALAMPDHPAGMRMSGELSHEVEPRNNETTTNATTSMEDSDESATDDNDDDDDDDDDEIHVQGKGVMCPEKQTEIMEIEKQCEEECKAMDKDKDCMTLEPIAKHVFKISKPSPEEAIIDMESLPVSESTDSPKHKHTRRSRKSYYYHCVLKKLELLNEVEIPSKAKMEAWIATNITDVTQREQLQRKLYQCLSEMKDETEDPESSTESTEETEQSTETASKKQDDRKCDMSKMLVCCLHRVECPVLTYP